MKFLTVFIWCVLLAANADAQRLSPDFDIQGHRGARGLMPENSIPGFLKALEIGVNTLELDTVVSMDGKIVVSHDPYFSADISLDRDGKPIPADKQTTYNLFKMNYDEIKLFDVGSLGNKRFPGQQKMKVVKPLLSDVFKETRKYIKEHKLKSVMYNIETKSTPAGDNVFQPAPAVFAKILYDEIVKNKMQKFVTIQSFDVRTLQEFKKFKIKMPLVLLVENKERVEKNIEKLGFQPDVYSPNYLLVDKSLIEYCHSRGIKVIPWTVNETSDMEVLKKLNIDGIISDYPDRAVKVFRMQSSLK
jgi:glycerophosphoryl diester phosphodiesterase